MSNYRLHARLGSGSFVIEAVLALLQIPYELVSIESTPSTPLPEEFVKTNPWKQIPVLELETGETLTEVAAILFWLERHHPDAFHRSDFSIADMAAFYRWTVFLAVNIYEGTLRRSYPRRFVNIPHADNPEVIQAIQSAGFTRNQEAFRLLERELQNQQGLCGDCLSPTDVFAAMLYAWHNEQPDLPLCAELTSRVANHPDIAPIWTRNFAHRLDHNWVRYTAVA